MKTAPPPQSWSSRQEKGVIKREKKELSGVGKGESATRDGVSCNGEKKVGPSKRRLVHGEFGKLKGERKERACG